MQPLKNAMELQKGENRDFERRNEAAAGRPRHAQSLAFRSKNRNLHEQLLEQQDRLAKLDERLKNRQLSHSGLAENLETVKTVASQGGDVNAFPLAEVDYLLRLADTKLKLGTQRSRRPPGAGLRPATAGTPSTKFRLAPVQTMLGEAIASLRGVQLPDITGLCSQAGGNGKAGRQLCPLKIDSGVPDIKNRVKPTANVAVSADADRSWWDRSTEAVWNQFKDIVVIRRVRSDAPPLIAMEDEFFLRQNLRLELESMRMALLRGDAQAYQDSQELVGNWTQYLFRHPGLARDHFPQRIAGAARRAVQSLHPGPDRPQSSLSRGDGPPATDSPRAEISGGTRRTAG
ncbi:MAG: uroporphyrinogen-III C-methyltransferase [Chromatiales bacterium]|nr:uroporphyrinogen-III C-methyltransferase [Chromatiales bacterium]